MPDDRHAAAAARPAARRRQPDGVRARRRRPAAAHGRVDRRGGRARGPGARPSWPTRRPRRRGPPSTQARARRWSWSRAATGRSATPPSAWSAAACRWRSCRRDGQRLRGRARRSARDRGARSTLIATGRPIAVDVGQASWGPIDGRGPGEPTGRRAFVVACGIGFDARVMAAATPELKRRLGFGAYVVSAARRGGPAATRRLPDRGRRRRSTRSAASSSWSRTAASSIPGLVGPRRPDRPDRRLARRHRRPGAGRRAGSSALAEVLVHDGGSARRPRSIRLRARPSG